MEGFYGQKEGVKRKLKKWIISGKVSFPWGQQGGLTYRVSVDQEIPD